MGTPILREVKMGSQLFGIIHDCLSFYGFCFAGLTAKVIDRTKTMADVYGAFFDFSVMLKAKVEIFLSDSAVA